MDNSGVKDYYLGQVNVLKRTSQHLRLSHLLPGRGRSRMLPVLSVSLCALLMMASCRMVSAGPVQETLKEGANLLAALRHGNPLIRSVTTRTSTTTETVVVTRAFPFTLCAKLVNVTGSCQTMRGGVSEQPVVLTFEDDMDEADELMKGFDPSKVLRFVNSCCILTH